MNAQRPRRPESGRDVYTFNDRSKEVRSSGNWKAWFERRERKNKKKAGRHVVASKNERPRNVSTRTSGVSIPRVVGEPLVVSDYPARSRIRTFAGRNRSNLTPAEKRLRRILEQLNYGVLRGKFKCQYPISGRWIVDFFFPEIRLAIEVDGAIHGTDEQRKLDRQKDADCKRFDITMLRITNREVFGNRAALIEKLRTGWRNALNRENRIIGMDVDEYFSRSRRTGR